MILSQLGAKIPASATILWVGISGFIVIAAAVPDSLLPLAHLLGIQLVSNLFLSSLVMFLLLVTFAQTLALVSQQRRLRQLITHIASANSPIDNADTHLPSALIVVPCYNEQGAITETVRQLDAICRQVRETYCLNYVIVNDCSIDATPSILRKIAPKNFISHGANVGVAGALWSGFQTAAARGYSYVIQCDADGQHPVSEIPALLNAAIHDQTDLLVGSRYNQRNTRSKKILASTTKSRFIGSQFIRSVLLLFGKEAQVSDPTSGFRVYSQRAWIHLMTRIPDEYPEPEIIAILATSGFKIREYAVEMNSRMTGTSSLAGLASIRFMIKVSGALCGLRLRLWMMPKKNKARANSFS